MPGDKSWPLQRIRGAHLRLSDGLNQSPQQAITCTSAQITVRLWQSLAAQTHGLAWGAIGAGERWQAACAILKARSTHLNQPMQAWPAPEHVGAHVHHHYSLHA